MWAHTVSLVYLKQHVLALEILVYSALTFLLLAVLALGVVTFRNGKLVRTVTQLQREVKSLKISTANNLKKYKLVGPKLVKRNSEVIEETV